MAGPSAPDGIPAGTVTVYYDYGVAGQTQLCQATLSGGSGDSVNYSCSLASATQLPAGAYTNVVASYSGGSSSNTSFTYNASTSSPQSLTVSPASATPENTTTSLTLPTLTYGSEGSPAAFTGTVAGPASFGRDPRRDGHRLLRLRGRRADPAVPSDLERWQR